MTQRVELATVMDRLAVDEVISDYAISVDDGDWAAYEALFTRDGRADYRSAGGTAGGVREVSAWLARSLRMFPMRQHLIVNRRLRFGTLEQDTGDTARVTADYYNPLRLDGHDGAPDLVSGGRYAFALLRTPEGWRLTEVVVHEKWRHTSLQPNLPPGLHPDLPSDRPSGLHPDGRPEPRPLS